MSVILASVTMQTSSMQMSDKLAAMLCMSSLSQINTTREFF